jgi:hypothetical protein
MVYDIVFLYDIVDVWFSYTVVGAQTGAANQNGVIPINEF